ncbi:hypothetical protein HO133_009946 [Letharia lupina]|uniref:Uncharacterized protein n=1 Tax=Letharia lupina TaxID=560253 RepID=A0A8H6FDR2_9LECA|nr:uncharacterized protein HO133_009946 [Letharia lupina]KAF6224752.1 hypothetical protein HO133_009946 [Letharia lupina]
MPHPTPLASLQEQMTQMMEMIRIMSTRLEALEARSRPTQPATQPAHQVTQQATPSVAQSDTSQEEDIAEKSAETVSSSSDTTDLLSTISHQPDTQQEEDPLQANAESTAEKSSDSKAPSTKNTAQLSKIPRHMPSTIPHQTITQQAENTTAAWPIIPTTSLWHTITELSIEEKDLLRRSQPNHYGYGNWTSAGKGLFRRKIGRCIFGRIETAFTAAGELMGFTPLIGLVSPFLSGISKTHSFMHAYFLP